MGNHETVGKREEQTKDCRERRHFQPPLFGGFEGVLSTRHSPSEPETVPDLQRSKEQGEMKE